MTRDMVTNRQKGKVTRFAVSFAGLRHTKKRNISN